MKHLNRIIAPGLMMLAVMLALLTWRDSATGAAPVCKPNSAQGDVSTDGQVCSTHFNNPLSVAQGGTGAATLTGVLVGNGTSAFSTAANTDITGLLSAGDIAGLVATNGLVKSNGSTTFAAATGADVQALAYLSGATSNIGGSALAAGACASGTASVTGARGTMAVAVSPAAAAQADASHGLSVYAYVSANDTVTVEVCAIVGTTPTARAYNVRVFP